jgi:hypothetical protein
MTSTAPAGRVRIRLGRDPGQLLAAIPHLLGFRPEHSVVLVGHRGRGPTLIDRVLRADLPPPGQEHELARHLAGAMGVSEAFGVTAVVIEGAGPRGDSTDQAAERLAGTGLPHTVLLDALDAELGGRDLTLLHALWVPEIAADRRWQCYGEDGCGGVLPDPGSTVAAAATVSTGQVTYPSRKAVEELLSPDDPAALARRGELLDRLVGERITGDHGDARLEQDCAEVRAALDRSAAGEPALSDAEIARLSLALSDLRVRDACLATAAPADGAQARAAERLWLALARGAPAPERAQPACLLGYAAYLRGDGAFAGMAFEAALRAQPGHTLAGLLHTALSQGVPPARLDNLGALDGVVNLADPLADGVRRSKPPDGAG